MGALLAILSTFGAGLGSLFSWIVGLFIKRQADEAQASAQMDQDIAAHANDGSISVADQQSLQAQDQDLEAQKKP